MERKRKVQMANQSAPKNKAKFCSLVINFYYQLYKVRTTFKAGQSVTKFTRNCWRCFCRCVPGYFLSLWSKSVTTSVQTYRVKSLTALVFLSLWSFIERFWTGQVIVNFREIISVPVAIACSITLSFTDQNLKGGVLKLN